VRYRAEVYDFWDEKLLVTYEDIEAPDERFADEQAAVRADWEGYGDAEGLQVHLTPIGS
jgi:hypothetical protein